MKWVAHLLLGLMLSACGGSEESPPPVANGGDAEPHVAATQDENPASEQLVVPGATIERLDDTFVGPPYDSDRAAVDALSNALRDSDLSRMQAVWSRMRPHQKLAAREELRKWVATLEDEAFDRIDAGYQLLNRVNWAGVHAENEALKATAGLEFGDLHGRVLDPDTNEPVVGMTISAQHMEHGLSAKMSLSKVSAVTDAEGRFELTQIPVGDIKMVGLLNTHRLQAEASIAADQVVSRDFVAERLNRIEVEVLFAGEVTDAETGQPVMSAKVYLDGKVDRTKANGRYIFNTPPGTYQVRVEHADYHSISAQLTTPDSGAFRQDFELQPITTGIITGIAVDKETGAVLANATINVGGQAVTTDTQGRFRVEEVESGDVEVSASSDGYKLSRNSIELAARSTAEARLELEAIKFGTVDGVVVDAMSGNALAGASVIAGGSSAETDDEGRFVLTDVPIGDVSVLASKPIYEDASEQTVVPPGKSVTVALALTPVTYGTVRVVVLDATTREPLGGSEVRINSSIPLLTDEAGVVTLESVDAGDVTVAVQRPVFRNATFSAVLAPAEVLELPIYLDPITVGTVEGIVRHAQTQAPLAGVLVTAGGVQAITAEDGRYTLAEVDKGNTQVKASKDVFYDTQREIAVLPDETVELAMDLVPITTGTITVQVVDTATQVPLADAEVTLADRALRTDISGEVTFTDVSAGSVNVGANKAVYTPDTATVEIVAAGNAQVTLALTPITTGTVVGTVVDTETGTAIADAEITIAGQAVRTDTSGSYRLENIAAGEHGLNAEKALYEPNSVRAVVLAAQTATLDIELVRITYGTLDGRVLNAATGEPVVGASVSAGGKNARSDADGAFSIERVAAGELNVTASKPVFETYQQSVELQAATTRTVEVHLEPITYGAITGIVVDAETGTALANASVNVAGQSLTSDANGRFALERADAGDVIVSASKPRYVDGTARLALKPDQNQTVEVALVPIKVGRVVGRVVDKKTDQVIPSVRITLRGQSIETGADGAFEFTDVLAGEQVVSGQHADYGDGSATGTLAPAETLTLTLRLDLRREDVTQLEQALATKGTIDLYGIHFDSGKDQFKSSSLGTLNAVLKVMERAPERRFVLAGHTDSDGSEASNQNLSERRARTVINWLVERGVAAERLTGAGFGEQQPAAPNDTESGKALNRRVQLSYSN